MPRHDLFPEHHAIGPEVRADIQQAWALEAERRDAEIDAGQVTLTSGVELLTRLGKQLPSSARNPTTRSEPAR